MKICENCGEEFAPNDRSQRFCNRSCSVSWHNRNNPKRKPSPRMFDPCLMPGCTAIPNYRAVYCSIAHSALHKRSMYLIRWLRSGDAGTISAMSEGHAIRDYLYAMQDEVCALCPQTRVWNGKPLLFILDHIDGNSEDSSRGNLRLVCPNCDTQLPTYKAKNVGQGRHSRRTRARAGLSY